MKNNSFLDTSFLFLMKNPNDPDIFFFITSWNLVKKPPLVMWSYRRQGLHSFIMCLMHDLQIIFFMFNFSCSDKISLLVDNMSMLRLTKRPFLL